MRCDVRHVACGVCRGICVSLPIPLAKRILHFVTPLILIGLWCLVAVHRLLRWLGRIVVVALTTEHRDGLRVYVEIGGPRVALRRLESARDSNRIILLQQLVQLPSQSMLLSSY